MTAGITTTTTLMTTDNDPGASAGDRRELPALRLARVHITEPVIPLGSHRAHSIVA